MLGDKISAEDANGFIDTIASYATQAGRKILQERGLRCLCWSFATTKSNLALEWNRSKSTLACHTSMDRRDSSRVLFWGLQRLPSRHICSLILYFATWRTYTLARFSAQNESSEHIGIVHSPRTLSWILSTNIIAILTFHLRSIHNGKGNSTLSHITYHVPSNEQQHYQCHHQIGILHET